MTADHPRRERYELAILLIAFAACSLFAITIPPVPDHAYQLYVAGRVLDGAKLYVDVAAADSHPPLFTWMAMAVERLSRGIGASAFTTYFAFVCCAIGAAMAAMWRLGLRSPATLSIVLLVLFPLSSHFFGQGEQLALILCLPYLTAAAYRTDASLRTETRLAIAATAAFGLAMKPYFALVWIGVELYLARKRGVRSIFRLESVCIGSLFVLYVLLTAVFTPEFFEVLPWIAQLYPKFASVPLTDILIDARTLFLIAAIASVWLVRGDGTTRSLAVVLSIAAVAMYVSVLLQKKDWGYHWYPVVALSVLTLAVSLSPRITSARLRMAIAPVALAASIFLMSGQPDRTGLVLISPPSYLPDMMDVTERYAKGQSIVVLSHTLNAGFPLVNLTSVDWASPYGHLWMVPAIYEDAWAGRKPLVYRDSGRWASVEQAMFDRLWDAIERQDPAITIILLPLKNGFDFKAYFETDERFRRRFQSSPPLVIVADYYLVLGRPRAAETAPPN